MVKRNYRPSVNKNYTGRQNFYPETRLYFSEGFWCVESESVRWIALSYQGFEISQPEYARNTVFAHFWGYVAW